LKISYVVNQYPKVSHSFIRREILALERQGFDVQRLAIRGWDDPLPDEIDRREREQTRYVLRDGLRALLAPTLFTLLRSPIRFLAALKLTINLAQQSDRALPYHIVYLAEACQVLSWVRRHGADHIHAHFGTNSAAVAMLVHALGGPPYSFTVHGPDEFTAPMGLGEKINHAEFVVAISCFGRSQLYLRSRYSDWPKIHVIHCGLESSFHDQESGGAPAGPRIVCVGRLCEAKGQLLLIEAAARLMRAGIACELVLAGDGPLRGEIEALIERLDLTSQVRVTGWISSDRVRAEILAARALILPTFAEGLPVVLMEAMALRRPVLSTYVAGIPELVIPGENGWLFPAGSIEDLVSAMATCLSTDPTELSRMGDSGYARVIARHSIDRESAKLADLFRAARPRSERSCPP
jgi:colanic acid/amylovoran biosynthesis glycosyltransferase